MANIYISKIKNDKYYHNKSSDHFIDHKQNVKIYTNGSKIVKSKQEYNIYSDNKSKPYDHTNPEEKGENCVIL